MKIDRSIYDPAYMSDRWYWASAIILGAMFDVALFCIVMSYQ